MKSPKKPQPKSKPQRPEFEPHELAGQLTKSQMEQFAVKLVELANRKRDAQEP